MAARIASLLLGSVLLLGLASETRAQSGIDAGGQFYFTIPFGGDGKGPGPFSFGLRVGPDDGVGLGETPSFDPLDGFVLEFDALGAGRVALGWFEWNWAPVELRLPSPYATDEPVWSAGYLQDPAGGNDPQATSAPGQVEHPRDGRVTRFAPGGADNPTASVPLSAGFLGAMFEGLTINVPLGSFEPETSNLGAELARSRRDGNRPR